MIDLRRTDLNLLVSLDALIEEANVTRAAARLNISQPALSAQLARLRHMLRDPLLVPSRSGRGMIPTARALELRGPVQAALKELKELSGARLHSIPGRRPERSRSRLATTPR